MKINQIGVIALLTFSLSTFGFAQSQFGATIESEGPNNSFGLSLDMVANGLAFVGGAKFNNDAGNNAGHARVFRFGAGGWTQQGQDMDGQAAFDFFGSDVNISANGTVVAVGAENGNQSGADGGEVRCFSLSGGQWVPRGQTLTGVNSNDNFGRTLSLSDDGNLLAVGAIGAVNENTAVEDAGSVQVFEYDGTNWVQLGQTIFGESETEFLGSSVKLSGDGSTLFVGAVFNDEGGENAGQIRSFRLQTGTWTQVGNTINGRVAGEELGAMMAVSENGNFLSVGLLRNDDGGENAGQVRAYQLFAGTWSQIGEDINGLSAGDQFGRSVALSDAGNVMIVGAPTNEDSGISAAGQARIFQFSGGDWLQLGDPINGVRSFELFGGAVSLSANGRRAAVSGAGYGGFVRVYALPMALPVELTTFSAAVASKEVVLDWTTAMEAGSSDFAIERKGENTAWAEIGTLPAAGYAEVPTNYEFVDVAPVVGTNFYRLRQNDLDGSSAYSPIRSVEFAGLSEAGVLVKPNPTLNGELSVLVPDEFIGGEISVVSLLGQVVQNTPVNAASNKVNLARKGGYFLRITKGSRQMVRMVYYH